MSWFRRQCKAELRNFIVSKNVPNPARCSLQRGHEDPLHEWRDGERHIRWMQSGPASVFVTTVKL